MTFAELTARCQADPLTPLNDAERQILAGALQEKVTLSKQLYEQLD